jgi:hypothetical protein
MSPYEREGTRNKVWGLLPGLHSEECPHMRDISFEGEGTRGFPKAGLMSKESLETIPGAVSR